MWGWEEGARSPRCTAWDSGCFPSPGPPRTLAPGAGRNGSLLTRRQHPCGVPEEVSLPQNGICSGALKAHPLPWSPRPVSLTGHVASIPGGSRPPALSLWDSVLIDTQRTLGATQGTKAAAPKGLQAQHVVCEQSPELSQPAVGLRPGRAGERKAGLRLLRWQGLLWPLSPPPDPNWANAAPFPGSVLLPGEV